MGWLDKLDKYKDGGKFLNTNSPKLPGGRNYTEKDIHSELAGSIGGENGEPAYLIPFFKYGKPLKDPIGEYKKTGEHLGGPFKTWQEADEWDKNVRHPYVEHGIPIPMQYLGWGQKYKDGGITDSTTRVPFPVSPDVMRIFKIDQPGGSQKDTANYLSALKSIKDNGGPKITFTNKSAKFAPNRPEGYRSRYSSDNNEIIVEDQKINDPRTLLLNEVPHAKQFQIDGWGNKPHPEEDALRKQYNNIRLAEGDRKADDWYDKNYYNTPGTNEYNAHKEIAPVLIKEWQRVRDSTLNNMPKFNTEGVAMFPDGGKVQPFVTSDVNEYKKRKQAYDDSLSLFNYSQLQHKLEPTLSNWLNPFATNKHQRENDQFELEKVAQDLVNSNPRIKWLDNRYSGTAAQFIKSPSRNPNIKSGEVMNAYYPEIWGNDIKPYPHKGWFDGSSAGSPDIEHYTIKPIDTWWGRGQNFDFAKPKQDVIFQQPSQKQELKKQVLHNKEYIKPIPTKGFNSTQNNQEQLLPFRQQPQINSHINTPTGAPMYNTIDNGGDFIGYNTNLLPSQIGNYTPKEIQEIKAKGYFQEYGDGGIIANTYNTHQVNNTRDNTGHAPYVITKSKQQFALDKKNPLNYPIISNNNIPDDIRDVINKDVNFTNKFKQVRNIADVATDVMQLGQFIPLPQAQLIGELGNILGAPIDIAQAHDSYKNHEYVDATGNAVAAFVPGIFGEYKYTRDMYNTVPNTLENTIASLGNRNGKYIPLVSKPSLRNNPVIKNALIKNKSYAGAISGEGAYDELSNFDFLPPTQRFPITQLSKSSTPLTNLTGVIEKELPLSKEQEVWNSFKNLRKKQMGGGVSLRNSAGWLDELFR